MKTGFFIGLCILTLIFGLVSCGMANKNPTGDTPESMTEETDIITESVEDPVVSDATTDKESDDSQEDVSATASDTTDHNGNDDPQGDVSTEESPLSHQDQGDAAEIGYNELFSS